MGNRAARWLAAATAGLVITVPPILASGETPPTASAAVRVAPSDGTRVIFEVVPASPTATATPQPTPSTPQPSPHTPTPSHGGKLPVTGSDGGSVLFLLALGVTLVAIGWLAARRRRPS
ncbi:LPXTG cell wall anchor domain-containing protein [Micromonospora sp. WMMD729]|uniref:LPXTG cell wall anchor domain-containing protein n=1 Tax=Micromonospora sp. WMMD729 TaxID=3404127 RepID=UPI003BF47738